MLTLKRIEKDYQTGDTKVEALRGIDLEFRACEFAAILGPSGCGKTTLLNIIGGLDQYSRGDLIVNGRSTKQFRDNDWDTYRNHSIGFVFQSYNLIPHQTVLSNVELALTLSGVSREERRRRAREALEKVGLGDQIKKKPNQLSGGQMQRVAIARALVNDPEILLADEPTGALDSETSVQVMEILKEIARDKLVIMVTHNPELADTYATRIIRLLDGKVVSDSNPCEEEEPKAGESVRQKKPSMSFMTALSLSLNNLLTKKGRTLLTAFAGSIGIIGIALILSMASGANRYIDRVQEDTLSSYPLEIEERSVDMTSMLSAMTGMSADTREHEEGKIYSGSRMTNLMSSMMSEVTENNLSAFKKYLDSGETGIDGLVSGIQYEYNTPLTLYRIDEKGKPVQVNPSTTLEATGMMSMMQPTMTSGLSSTMMNVSNRRMNAFQPLLDNDELIRAQYDVLAGRMPQAMDEVVLIVSRHNELSDYVLYTLGIKDQGELAGQFEQLMLGVAIESEDMEFTYDELLALRFKLMINTDFYEKQGDQWMDRHNSQDYLMKQLENAMEIKVVGILRPAEGVVASSISSGVGYRNELMAYLLEQVNSSEIVQQQLANPDIDIFTGQPFGKGSEEMMNDLDQMDFSDFIDKYASAFQLTLEQRFMIGMLPKEQLNSLPKEQVKTLMSTFMPGMSGLTLEENLETLGVSSIDHPASIYIYPKDFYCKEKIIDLVDAYNKAVSEEDVIHYTDYVGLLMSSVTTIINAVSYVLIAFVAISLVVSSIMIGIITYISVLERTKEIGILRAIGASKRDISRVFNAETLIVGFAAGVIGILVTLVLVGLVNMIIYSVTGIANIAGLPVSAGLVLVLISMALTLIAGVIPSRLAAKKDPVVALRTE